MGEDTGVTCTFGFYDENGNLQEFEAESLTAISYMPIEPDAPPPLNEISLTLYRPKWWEFWNWPELYRWVKQQRQLKKLLIQEVKINLVYHETGD